MRIEINGVRLFFDVEGAKLVPDGPVMREKPTLILLHGGPGMDGSYWKPDFSDLADVAQVIYLDQRGCGRSDRGSPADWTLAQWGDDVWAFCDVLEIEQPIVCGSSFGGEVAMSYATRHLGHPAKLILLSCSARLDIGRIAEAFRRLGGDEVAVIARRFWSDFNLDRGLDYMKQCAPLYFRTPQDPDREARSIINSELTLEYLKNGGEAQTVDFRLSLRNIQCPTLVMGGEDDPVVPIEDMAEIASIVPVGLVRFETIPDCGHGPFFDRPQRTIEVIRDFIAAWDLGAMRISVNGVLLFFDVDGAKLVPAGPTMREKPTLILLHGGPGMDHSSFKPAFSQYADIAQIVYIDHRGNGRSDRQPQDKWTLAQWGDDIYEFCQALEIEKPIVMGQSFGGFVAISYATRHPEHPGKVIFSSTAAQGQAHIERSIEIFEQKGGPEIATMAHHALTVGYDSPEFAMKWVAEAMPYYNTKATADPDARARGVMTGKVLMDFLGPGGEGLCFDLLADLAKIQCPALILGGEEDPITPIESQEDIADAIPPQWVQFERFSNAGHGPFRDDPRAYDVIRNFILS